MANKAVIPKLSTCRGLKYVLFEGVSAGRQFAHQMIISVSNSLILSLKIVWIL